MSLSNIHTHTVFSDGQSTPEEYIKVAIEKGFVSIGFSDHSPVIIGSVHEAGTFDHHMSSAGYFDYIVELQRLKEKYKKQIEIYIGIEEDYYPVTQRVGVEYVIGAVHFLQSPSTGKMHMPDYTVEEFESAAASFGSVQRFVEAYYSRLHWIVKEHRPDVLAHFDVITLLNQGNRFFDSTKTWYRQMVLKTLDEVAKTSVIIELNSGAVFRGYRTEPYPDEWILHEMFKRKIPIILSSDAHHVDGIDFAFSDMTALAKDHGYQTVKQLRGGAFQDTSI